MKSIGHALRLALAALGQFFVVVGMAFVAIGEAFTAHGPPHRPRKGDSTPLEIDDPKLKCKNLALVDAAYTAATKRLAEQRDRLEGLRTRAAALLSVAGVIVTFVTGIGLFGKDSRNGLTLPTWCLGALAGVLLLLVICTIAALQPTLPSWMHGPPSQLMIETTRGKDDDPTAIKAAATKRMNAAAEIYNGPHLDYCAWWYRAGSTLLGIEVLLIIIGVATA